MSAFPEGLDINQKILMWKQNAALLKEVKGIEMAQRKELFGAMFPEPKVGTNTHDLGNDYALKGVYGFEKKIDEAAYQLIEPELRKMGEAAMAAVADAVNWKPSLVAKGYNALPEEVRELFDEAVTSKPKTVTLTLVEPKSK